MQVENLKRELTSLTNKWSEREEGLHPEMQPLQEVAEQFAAAAVGTFTGDLLDSALQVSKSIAEFTMQFDRHATAD